MSKLQKCLPVILIGRGAGAFEKCIKKKHRGNILQIQIHFSKIKTAN